MNEGKIGGNEIVGAGDDDPRAKTFGELDCLPFESRGPEQVRGRVDEVAAKGDRWQADQDDGQAQRGPDSRHREGGPPSAILDQSDGDC